MQNLFFTGAIRHFICICLYYIFLHLKKENYWINLISVHEFKSKQSFNKNVTRSGVFKCFIKSFKDQYVHGFLKTWALFLF